MYKIAAKTQAVLLKPDGSKMPFYTRIFLDFEPNEMIKFYKGELTFKRKGYILVVSAKFVRLPQSAGDAVRLGMQRISKNKTYETKDKEIVESLANSLWLSTAQIVFGARLILKYRDKLPGLIVVNATKILTDKEREK